METKKRKILYIIPWLYIGGAERFIIDLIKSLDRSKFEAKLVCVKKSGGSVRIWKEELDQIGIPVIEFNHRRKIDLKNLLSLYHFIKKENPDIVHTQLFLGDVYGRIAAKLAGVKHIVNTEQNLNFSEGRRKQAVKALLSFLSERIFAISLSVKNYCVKFEKADKNKISIIHNGLDTKKFEHYERRYGEKKLVVGSIGRLAEQKDYGTLIKAMGRLDEKNIECRLAGEGEMRGELEVLIKELKIEERVKLTGWEKNTAEFLRQIDIFVLPSKWEGLGIAVLEAGMSGLPVIGSNVDGIKEIISNKEDGMLFEAGDDKELADLIAFLALNQNERRRLGENLREKIKQNFDIKKIASRYEDAYFKILSNKFKRPTLAYRVSAYNRERKWRKFKKYVPFDRDTKILDIGYNEQEYSATDNYLEKNYPYLGKVTALGLEKPFEFSRRYPEVKALKYDGKNIPFADNSFKVAWSNAVLEHVGDRQSQVEFLKEVKRVARIGFITTPNKNFPIEIHTRTPLLHFLPKKIFDRYLRLVGKKWATGNYMNLLGIREIRMILKQAGIARYKIIKNRLFGFVLDYIIVFEKI